MYDFMGFICVSRPMGQGDNRGLMLLCGLFPFCRPLLPMLHFPDLQEGGSSLGKETA